MVVFLLYPKLVVGGPLYVSNILSRLSSSMNQMRKCFPEICYLLWYCVGGDEGNRRPEGDGGVEGIVEVESDSGIKDTAFFSTVAILLLSSSTTGNNSLLLCKRVSCFRAKE